MIKTIFIFSCAFRYEIPPTSLKYVSLSPATVVAFCRMPFEANILGLVRCTFPDQRIRCRNTARNFSA
jgi:hypothetical protein